MDKYNIMPKIIPLLILSLLVTSCTNPVAPRPAPVEAQPDQTTPIRSPSGRTAGIGLIKHNEQWTVYNIMPNTPAGRLDIKVGDQVIAVNKTTADQLDLDQWAKLVDSTNVLFLRLQRNNEAFAVIVPVIESAP